MVKDLVAVENTGAAAVRKRALTPAQYGDLADVPPELEWLANITNKKTRRAYKIDVERILRLRRPDGTRAAAHRDPRPRHRLAQGSGGPRAVAGQHPPQALGPVVAVRLSVRAQRRRRQSRGRRQAADGQRQ